MLRKLFLIPVNAFVFIANYERRVLGVLFLDMELHQLCVRPKDAAAEGAVKISRL